LLTRLRSEINGQNGGSVLAFTSANPGEGVSYVVRFFGEKLAAQTGRRTLIVDARRLLKKESQVS
jgi:Mrp family chromosome partitioning ATPase